MPESTATVILTIGGLAVISAGWGIIRTQLKQAQRVHRAISWTHGSLSDGWQGWFAQGFSTATAGAGLVVSVMLGMGLAVCGVMLVSLGLRWW